MFTVSEQKTALYKKSCRLFIFRNHGHFNDGRASCFYSVYFIPPLMRAGKIIIN